MSIIMRAGKIIEQQITDYLPHLNTKQKQAVLSVVKTFAAEQQDWWEEISDEQRLAIDKALLDIKAGKITPHDEVIKNYKKWLKK